MQQLTVVQVARQAGFTIAEMQALFHVFTPDTPLAARWQDLAEQKLCELDTLIERARNTKPFQGPMLPGGLRCGCLRLEDCLIVEGEERRRG